MRNLLRMPKSVNFKTYLYCCEGKFVRLYTYHIRNIEATWILNLTLFYKIINDTRKKSSDAFNIN